MGSTISGELDQFSPGGTSLEEQGKAKICTGYHPSETSLLVFPLTLPGSPPAKSLSGNPQGLKWPQIHNNSQCTQETRSSAWKWPSFSQPVLVWTVVPHIRERKILAL